jgi:hypothetical protein
MLIAKNNTNHNSQLPTNNCISSINPPTHTTCKSNDKSYLLSLPDIKELDKEIIKTLPAEIRRELAKAYKDKAMLIQNQSNKQTNPKISNNSTYSYNLEDLPSCSQVDPEYMAALPFDIRKQIEHNLLKAKILKQKQPNTKLITTSAENYTDKTKNNKKRKKQTPLNNNKNKLTKSAAPHESYNSIVTHFYKSTNYNNQNNDLNLPNKQQNVQLAYNNSPVELYTLEKVDNLAVKSPSILNNDGKQISPLDFKFDFENFDLFIDNFYYWLMNISCPSLIHLRLLSIFCQQQIILSNLTAVDKLLKYLKRYCLSKFHTDSCNNYAWDDLFNHLLLAIQLCCKKHYAAQFDIEAI